LLASMALWGSMFDLQDALAIAIVLLVHESGHALAMRWLGWRDVSMFFVPLFGALATGRATRPAAWKQVIVLLAGPLPGLVAGGAVLWVARAAPGVVPVEWLAFTIKLATLAVVINLLNLLPLSPLDGGRLVELSVFTRWPRARVAFLSMGSAALAVGAFVWRDGVLAVLALLLLIWLPTQWRIARLQSGRDAGEADERALRLISESTVARFPAQPLARQYMIFSGALNALKLPRPARWESAMALVALLLVWGLAGPVALRHLTQGWAGVEGDTRTADQKAFDNRWDESEADEPDGPASPHRSALRELEARLSAEDPRHVDVQVNEAMRMSEPQRGERIERIVLAGRDGVRWPVAGLVTMHLSEAEAHARQVPLDQRLARLDDTLDWATRVAPTRLAPTIRTRLRRAEVLDQLGREDETVASLDDLRRRVAAADDCRCAVHEVVQAQAWHRVEHDDAKGAVAVIDEASAALSTSGRHALMRDRAWALLLDGQTDRGLAQMKEAVPIQGNRPGDYIPSRLDLVFALDQAGKDSEARELAANLHEWQCQEKLSGPNGDADAAPPWQRRREAALTATARHHCRNEGDRSK
jgi:Zn-dependent protease